jgi:putative tryptophan/tyrosine transport system substrate-binding protein
MTPDTRLSSTNCDASVSLKAKTSVEYRAYGQHVDLISQYAAELINARVDVIAVTGDATVRAIQQATKTIPIVALTDDLFASGFVNSLGRPDGNTTGVSILVREGDGKRQDILIEAVPGLRRMAVLTDVNDAITARLDALQEAARAHGIEFSIHRVGKGGEIAAAIDSAQASGATALNIVASPLFYANRHLIMQRAAAAHLPTLRSTNFPNRRRKVVLPPTDRVVVSSMEK